MLASVVPVQNEETRLNRTIETLIKVSSGLIIPVINGSDDNSYNIARQAYPTRVVPIYYNEVLGIDIPRAIGARVALERGAAAVLFIDGDMDGDISENLQELVLPVLAGRADMALTDCYPGNNRGNLSPLASRVLEARRKLNREIGMEETIGAASPSHGPHAVSRRLLLSVPLREVAMPPVSLALAVKGGLKVSVGAMVPHKALGSPEKGLIHSDLIAQTIIGDCIEAHHVYRGEKRTRSSGSREYIGYHLHRRWDLLDEFLRQHLHKKTPA